MSQAAKAAEPSMEEILASIRKIISDDDAQKPDQAAAEPAKAEAPMEGKPQSQDDIDALLADFDAVGVEEEAPPAKPAIVAPVEPEVFELTEAVAVAKPAAPPPLPKPNNDLEFVEALAPPPPVKAAPMPDFAEIDREPLLSNEANRAVSAAFGSLGSLSLASGGTVDGLVRELLRPLLKQWLDENLPPLVEKLVKAEIERAARGGR